MFLPQNFLTLSLVFLLNLRIAIVELK